MPDQPYSIIQGERTFSASKRDSYRHDGDRRKSGTDWPETEQDPGSAGSGSRGYTAAGTGRPAVGRTLKRELPPFAAVALHAGHRIRRELHPLVKVSALDRLREEDPYTDYLTSIMANRIIVIQSRFEVDLNRSRAKAIYSGPDEAWGLDVWKERPDSEMMSRSLSLYDRFYDDVKVFLEELVEIHGFVVVFDLHSYNYRLNGPDTPSEPAEENPDINLGTSNLNRELWSPVVDGLTVDLKDFDFPGGKLDVRENVKFSGGYFTRWIHEQFGDRSCAIAVEVKKFFMDEWTGKYHPRKLASVRKALRQTIPAMIRRSWKIESRLRGVLK